MRPSFTIQSLHAQYANGLQPREVAEAVLQRVEDAGDAGIFLQLESRQSLFSQADALGGFDPEKYPLWGIPFAVKDNIDVKGRITTAACPAFAYEAEEDAVCVRLLREAGAILVGKTNLDQFATGLVGVRTPYPPPRNPLDPDLIPGGSSSGSAVAVARGIVSFALGTDTAGSGRVPAAYNNIVGLKPTLGAISSRGVVPACRSIDTVSVLALTVEDAYAVLKSACHYDENDPYARPVRVNPLSPPHPNFRVGVPSAISRTFSGDSGGAVAFERTLARLESLGGDIVEIDFAPFYAIARLLYDGAWLAERYAVTQRLLQTEPDALHPVTRAVIEKASKLGAVDAFEDMYRLEALRRQVAPLLAAVDILCVPTVPKLYTTDEVQAEPIDTNSQLGTYTNFVNLLGMCGLAVPSGLEPNGRPSSVTLLAEAGADARVASLGRQLHLSANTTLGATGWRLPDLAPLKHSLREDEMELAVVGAHMSGLPLNRELKSLGARFLRRTRTAPCYRLFALPGGPPHKPGLVRDPSGSAIELETWAVPKPLFADFIAGVPAPLAIGTVALETHEVVKGFICEASGLIGATEITQYGGWRNYLRCGMEPSQDSPATRALAPFFGQS